MQHFHISTTNLVSKNVHTDRNNGKNYKIRTHVLINWNYLLREGKLLFALTLIKMFSVCSTNCLTIQVMLGVKMCS